MSAQPEVPPRRAIEFAGEVADRSIPSVRLERPGGGTFSLFELRGRRQAAVLFAHAPACGACLAYATRLAAEGEAMAETETTVVVAVRATADEAGPWQAALGPAVRVVADPDGAWRIAGAERVGFAADAVHLLVLDRYGAPRAGFTAADADGLAEPAEALAWLTFLALECGAGCSA